jgi:hypothetical protein
LKAGGKDATKERKCNSNSLSFTSVVLHCSRIRGDLHFDKLAWVENSRGHVNSIEVDSLGAYVISDDTAAFSHDFLVSLVKACKLLVYLRLPSLTFIIQIMGTELEA